MKYDKINIKREWKAKLIDMADTNDCDIDIDKTCDTCIWWKRYMLRTFPNTIYMDKKFPCNEPNFVRDATFGEQNKKKTKNDTCDKWAYSR